MLSVKHVSKLFRYTKTHLILITQRYLLLASHFYVWKLRLRAGKEFAQGHTASKWENQDMVGEYSRLPCDCQKFTFRARL